MHLQYSFPMPRASLPLMPRKTDVDDSEGDDQPKMTFFERLRYTMVKPDDDGNVKAEEPQLSREELEATIARANDKERNIGLVAAPVGAIVALFISADLIHHAQQTGQSTSTYQTLTFVLLGMAALILVASWLRKRLILGIVMALFGLGIFNLRYWGFGVPFLLAGSWYLVRAWRLNSKLKLAGGGSRRSYGPPNSQVSPNRLPSAGGVLPRPNKRYTPPTEKVKRSSRSKPQA
jgi:hypothetical protein